MSTKQTDAETQLETVRFESLQMLRAVAALMVVVTHSTLVLKGVAGNYWPEGDAVFRAEHYPAFINHLAMGVDIFFCISGFIMCYLVEKVEAGAISSVRFLANRAVRIFPPYWFFTFAVLITYLVSHGKLNVGQLTGNLAEDSFRLLESFTLFPSAQAPMLGVGWTLIHENIFYLLCGVVILLGLNRRLPEALFALSLLSVLFWILEIDIWHGYFGSTFYIEFFSGAFAYRILKRSSRVFPLMQLALAVVSYGSLSQFLDGMGSDGFGTLYRPIGGAIIGILLICGLVGADKRYGLSRRVLGKFMIRIGNASYTLYLSHWFVLSAMGKFIGLIPSSPVPVIAVWHSLSIVAAIAFAVFVSEKIEMPLHRTLTWSLKRPLALPGAPSA